jgi:hypothetical protein
MNTVEERTKTLERFLGQNVKVILRSPSGKRRLTPMDKLIYKEWREDETEGFYLEGMNIRLKPSQLTRTSLSFTRERVPYVLLSFDLGKYVMVPLSHEQIKDKLYSNN